MGLGMKEPPKKPKNWKLDDFYKLAKIIGISELNFKKEARRITERFITRMPEYINRLKIFEKSNPLIMQKIRIKSNKSFSDRVNNMFNERVITLKKLGIISELELTDIAGGLLSSHKNSM